MRLRRRLLRGTSETCCRCLLRWQPMSCMLGGLSLVIPRLSRGHRLRGSFRENRTWDVRLPTMRGPGNVAAGCSAPRDLLVVQKTANHGEGTKSVLTHKKKKKHDPEEPLLADVSFVSWTVSRLLAGAIGVTRCASIGTSGVGPLYRAVSACRGSGRSDCDDGGVRRVRGTDSHRSR